VVWLRLQRFERCPNGRGIIARRAESRRAGLEKLAQDLSEVGISGEPPLAGK
jgi:hypothetical protein